MYSVHSVYNIACIYNGYSMYSLRTHTNTIQLCLIVWYVCLHVCVAVCRCWCIGCKVWFAQYVLAQQLLGHYMFVVCFRFPKKQLFGNRGLACFLMLALRLFSGASHSSLCIYIFCIIT